MEQIKQKMREQMILSRTKSQEESANSDRYPSTLGMRSDLLTKSDLQEQEELIECEQESLEIKNDDERRDLEKMLRGYEIIAKTRIVMGEGKNAEILYIKAVTEQGYVFFIDLDVVGQVTDSKDTIKVKVSKVSKIPYAARSDMMKKLNNCDDLVIVCDGEICVIKPRTQNGGEILVSVEATEVKTQAMIKSQGSMMAFPLFKLSEIIKNHNYVIRTVCEAGASSMKNCRENCALQCRCFLSQTMALQQAINCFCKLNSQKYHETECCIRHISSIIAEYDNCRVKLVGDNVTKLGLLKTNYRDRVETLYSLNEMCEKVCYLTSQLNSMIKIVTMMNDKMVRDFNDICEAKGLPQKKCDNTINDIERFASTFLDNQMLKSSGF